MMRNEEEIRGKVERFKEYLKGSIGDELNEGKMIILEWVLEQSENQKDCDHIVSVNSGHDMLDYPFLDRRDCSYCLECGEKL